MSAPRSEWGRIALAIIVPAVCHGAVLASRSASFPIGSAAEALYLAVEAGSTETYLASRRPELSELSEVVVWGGAPADVPEPWPELWPKPIFMDATQPDDLCVLEEYRVIRVAACSAAEVGGWVQVYVRRTQQTNVSAIVADCAKDG